MPSAVLVRVVAFTEVAVGKLTALMVSSVSVRSFWFATAVTSLP